MTSFLLKITSPDWVVVWFVVEFVSIIIIAVGCGGEVYAELHKFSDKIKSSPTGGRLVEKLTGERIKGRWKLFWGGVVVLGLAVELIAFGFSFRASNREIEELKAANLKQEQQVEELRRQNDELEAKAAQLRAAIPPRQISENLRELFIDILNGTNNISPKIPVKVIVGDTNQEADDFARFVRKMLNDSGYGTNGEQIVRVPGLRAYPPGNSKDFRIPPLFVIYATDNEGKKIPRSMDWLGGIGTMIPEPIAVHAALQQKTPIILFRYTTNPNDIIYGISTIFEYIGFQPTEFTSPGTLSPGEVGFYVPPQVE